MTTPNPSNYTLGKGVLYFDRFDANGNLTGERDLGNAPELQFNMTIEMLDHLSSRAGIGAKDMQVTKMVTPTFSFTLDEFDDANLSMLFYGTPAEITVAATDYNTVAMPAVAAKNLYVSLGKRQIGIWKVVVAYEAGKSATDLVAGSTIAPVATVITNTWDVIAAIGNNVYLKNKVGTGLTAPTGNIFVAAGTDKIATYTVAPAFDSQSVLVKEGLVWTEAGTSFTVDSVLGRLKINDASVLVGGGTAYFATAADTYKQIKVLEKTSLRGKLRFVSENPEGSQYQFQAWNCSLKPNGDTAFISDNSKIYLCFR